MKQAVGFSTSSEWLRHKRKAVGKASVSLCTTPAWFRSAQFSAAKFSVLPSTVSLVDCPTLRLFKEIAEYLVKIISSWNRQDYFFLNSCIQGWEDLFDFNVPHVLTYFVGMGGFDIFVRILCEPPKPPRFSPQFFQDFPITLRMVMKVLTEILICHSEISWYLYDRYPGVVFRLLELIDVYSLGRVATSMLEHLISSVGPILEIARTPSLIKLLRAKDNSVLASACRIVALLIVPLVTLGHSPISTRRLTFPESLLPLKRVQRVIDSNVLWLLAEPNLIERLIGLCEVRAGGIRVQDGNRTMTLLIPNAMELANYYRLQNTSFFNTAMDLLLNEGQNLMAVENMLTESDTVNNVSSYSNGNEEGSLGFIAPLSETISNTAPFLRNGGSDNRSINNEALGNLIQQVVDETMPNLNHSSEENVTIDFSWLFGTGDTRQRWRLRDPTLTMEKDDTRAQLYYSASDGATIERFMTYNQEVIEKLAAETQLNPETNQYLKIETLQSIVDSQSEILFILNVMLSTFYFSDVWTKMKACQWMPRANKIYDAAFFLNGFLPPLMDLPPHIDLPSSLRKLPRFQPSSQSCHSANMQSECECATVDMVPASSRRRVYPPNWNLPPFSHMLGHDRDEYIKDFSTDMLYEFEDYEDKSHHHGPETIRKLELLHCIHEFWNTQDGYECELVHTDDIPEHASTIGEKMAFTLVACKEESCVEASMCHTLESYLRCFSFPFRTKHNASDCPQTVIGNILMSSILEERVYNATRVPGLSGSLRPIKRLEAVLSLTAELVRYHLGNLRLLCDYVGDTVLLAHLNNPRQGANRTNSIIHSSEDEVVETILKTPPLERQEFEPFGRVLLRRVFCFGSDSNLFLRAIVLSLTPGLRSSHNYISKASPLEKTHPALMSTNPNNRVADVVTGYPQRFAYIRQVSRCYTTRISQALDAAAATDAAIQGSGRPSRMLDRSSGSAETVSDLLVALLDDLENSPHRLPLKDRCFPTLFNADDRHVLRGEATLQLPGAPPLWRLPLFGNNVEDEQGLRDLAVLQDCLLAEPDKLVYCMLCSLHAELIITTNRLCVITTVLSLLLHEVHLEGSFSAVDRVLEDIRPLSERSYRKWKRTVLQSKERRFVAEKRPLPGSSFLQCVHHDAGDSKYSNSCSPRFITYGECHPQNDARYYYLHYGGCFYRNFFRLLCVWVGHFVSCQRYVETLYFSTDVAFAEYKDMVLYLMRVLPRYFYPSLE